MLSPHERISRSSNIPKYYEPAWYANPDNRDLNVKTGPNGFMSVRHDGDGQQFVGVTMPHVNARNPNLNRREIDSLLSVAGDFFANTSRLGQQPALICEGFVPEQPPDISPLAALKNVKRRKGDIDRYGTSQKGAGCLRRWHALRTGKIA